MKKLFVLFFSFAFVFATFAEGIQVKPVLTESDVSSFVKNYSKIRSELEKLDVDMQDTQSLALLTNVMEKLKDSLAKFGFSDEEAILKIRAIGMAFAIELFNKELEDNPQTAEMLKSLNFDPMALARSLVADSDVELVKKHFDELVEIFED